RGFSAVRFAVSRTAKEPKSGMVNRPLLTISARIASMMSPASFAEATPDNSDEFAITSVRNFFDIDCHPPECSLAIAEPARPVRHPWRAHPISIGQTLRIDRGSRSCLGLTDRKVVAHDLHEVLRTV